ncbi:hypothetical protein GGR52DRAFT_554804 [Hypoxylon sp. FL1284]|nr:hypothetical protein GGR52DRAFT_554804 [Hypoxylon sp. FL1284]
MAQFVTLESARFHPGEQAIQRLLGIPNQDNPTHQGLAPHLGRRVAISPLVAFGALDRAGRPWATAWGGEAGFCRPVAPGVLGVRATADAEHDPVLQELFAGDENEMGEGEGTRRRIVDGAMVTPEGGKLMAGLSIDFETRDRVKLAGRMAVGTVTRAGVGPGLGDLQLAFRVEESLGNCPKYINKKRVTPHTSGEPPRLVTGEGKGEEGSAGRGVPLPDAALDLIARADLFFIASKHGAHSMDVNHRGGAPGFVRVLQNDDSGETPGTATTTLLYPEYSGNRLYQSLGNLHEDPLAGLMFPDMATGDVLYATGRATVLAGDEAAALMPRARLVVRVDVDEARFVRGGLPFRGAVVDYSPYNPAVRRLAGEQKTEDATSTKTTATATLAGKTRLTPTVSRYAFRLSPTDGRNARKAWRPGGHVTLDFSGELDEGYAHMRDDDPQSLNDDFVRTFTVSRPLEDGDDGFEITVRRHGPATRLLERWNTRVPLELPVLGFGGSDGFRMAAGADGRLQVFVAAGVGITPLMAQAAGVLAASARLRVLWSLRAEDLPLAADVLEATRDLGAVTRLFVTGGADGKEEARAAVRGLGADVVARRIQAADVLAEGEKGARKYYCCAGPDLMKTLLKWVEGEEVAYESFEY